MASEYWNQIDKEKLIFKESYCAFLDILGYKEKVNLFFNGQYNLYGRIMRAMSAAGIEDSPLNTPDGVITRIFSDSIILSVDKSESSFYILLNYICQLAAWFSYEGLYLRGGVSIGKQFEDIKPFSNYSFIASESLIKAYNLEQVATYPMITVDEDILLEKSNNWDGLISKSGDKYIVNYVKYIINENAANQDDVLAELDEFIGIKNQLEDQNVIEKLNWIISYYLWYIHHCQSIFGKFDMRRFEKYDIELDKSLKFGLLK